MQRGRVTAVIVTHNSEQEIARCLRALRRASRTDFPCVVVDNASTDGTLAAVARADGRAVVLESAANVGYAAAINRAVDLLRSSESTCYLLLNPDVVLSPGAVDALLEEMERDPALGLVSPEVSRGFLGSPWSQTLGMRSLWGFPRRQPPATARVRTVDRLPGACMLVRARVFDVVGPFDEAYFLYWEEIDFCERARRAGFRIGVCQGVEVVHRPGEAGGVEAERPHRVYYMWRNQIRFAFRRRRALGTVFLMRRSITMLREGWRYAWAGRFDLLRAGRAGLAAGIRGERGRSSDPAAMPGGGRP